ncbi:MAG: DPP IV N-terminal domain-containing protein [Bdellovibrionales bacterium]|nr:DPP IV N-terminal domain-containing protein [Bdellovibrionales bacterium]
MIKNGIIKPFLTLFLVASSLFLFLGSYSNAVDQPFITVGQAKTKKSLIGLTPFIYFGADPQNKKMIDFGQELFAIIYNDLLVSNYFSFIDPAAYLENPLKKGLRPLPTDNNGFDFKNWQTLGADLLVRGGFKMVKETLEFEVYVYHVKQTRQILGKIYTGKMESVRELAHTFSNDLIKELTGKSGFFLSKIVATRREGIKNHKEIYVMDWDGARIKPITQHKSISISPSWSPQGDKIAYTSFAYHKNINSRNADLFIFDFLTGKRWLVSYQKGINSGANFLPNGKELLITISKNGNPDIYRVNSDGTNLRPITNGPNKAMNVEPAISPDGQTIAFSSDRSGEPMIYTMNLDGSMVKRLTFAGHYNSSPCWSPDGKYIVFSGYEKNHFDLFRINVDGSGLKRLTTARRTNGKLADNRDPSFSPDGSQIVFTSNRHENSQIFFIDIEGDNERRMTNDNYNWEQPKWSVGR